MSERAGPLAAFAGLVAFGFAGLLLATAFRPGVGLYGLPFTEDGFYALTIARNIAAGRGITIDGEVWTNGFQPLFTFLEAACFLVARGDEAIAGRMIVVLCWFAHVVGALLAGGVALDARPDADGRLVRAFLAVALYLAAAKFFADFYTGLETGLQLVMILALWRAVQRGAIDSVAGCFGLGVLIGLAVVTRIDVGILAAVLAGWALLRGWGEVGLAAVLRPLVMALAASAISSPWWLYNKLVFDNWVPSSGAAQQSWAFDIDRILEGLWALRVVLVPWIFAWDAEALATDLARSAMLALALALFLFMPAGSRRAMATAVAQRTAGFGWALVIAMAALAVFYIGSFFAYWFYFRYFAPLSLLAVVGVAVIAADFATRGALGSLAVAAALVIVAVAGGVMPWRAVQGLLGPSTHYPMVELVERSVPAGEVVAAGQSGTLGFFRSRVVNVDGKVNRDALDYQDRMWVYLEQRNIRWFVDSPWYVERMLGTDPAKHGWSLVAVAGAGDFRLYRKD
ncbi:MAG: hypothetical protein JNK67_24350 [Alphaproteobacteria bacterium]|nr:hypothetical protein [Alphaproteobacteria bacterium]